MSEQAQPSPQEKVDFMTTMALRSLTDRQDKMLELVRDGKIVNDYPVQDLWAAQATYSIWARIQKAVEAQAEKDEPATVQEIVDEFADQYRRDLIECRRSSRSTSTVHNAFEDVEADAKIRFLTDLNWGMKF